MGWVDPCVGLGRVHIFFMGWVGSTTEKYYKFERIMLMHLKHGYIGFGFTKQLNLILRPIWQVRETDKFCV